MRVCFIEDTRLHGGTQIWVAEAVRNFLAKGHKVTLLTPADGFNAKDGAQTSARVVTYDYEGVVSESTAHQDRWISALADADVAICTVHPPRQGFHCSRFAARCIATGKLNTVLQPKTGTIVPEYLREFYAPPEDIAWHVISITDFTRQTLIDTYDIPEDHVSLVYQGTDVVAFTPDDDRRTRARKRYPVPAKAFPILGSVGSFENRKGQTVLLEAVERVRKQLPNIHLMLVGDGPDEAMLKEHVVAMQLENNITFFPFTREPADVFEVIDILVLSSLYKEGLPNVLLEAMAMRRPVISSRMAGVPEVVFEGNTGLMVEPGSIDQLAAAIVRLGRNREECERMGTAGRRLMEDKFDKRQQFDAFLEHFARVCT